MESMKVVRLSINGWELGRRELTESYREGWEKSGLQ